MYIREIILFFAFKCVFMPYLLLFPLSPLLPSSFPLPPIFPMSPSFSFVVVASLVLNGETLDEISLAGRLRSQTLRGLVSLFPSQSSYVQWLAYTNQKLPTLMIFIALDLEAGELVGGVKGGGILSLMSDIVIYGNKEMKSWFSHYMKLMQQKVRIYYYIYVSLVLI